MHSNQCDLIICRRDFHAFKRTRAANVSSCGPLPLPMTLPFLRGSLGSAMLVRGGLRPPRGGEACKAAPDRSVTLATETSRSQQPSPKYCQVNLRNNLKNKAFWGLGQRLIAMQCLTKSDNFLLKSNWQSLKHSQWKYLVVWKDTFPIGHFYCTIQKLDWNEDKYGVVLRLPFFMLGIFKGG